MSKKIIIGMRSYGIGRVYPTKLFVEKPPSDPSIAHNNPYYLTDDRQQAAIFEDHEQLDTFAKKYIFPISENYHYEDAL